MMASMMPGESRSAGKRRSHDSMDDSLDDMLAGLTTKLSSVTHTDHDSLVATVCEVLGVDPGSASFYLEASNNDPCAAVEMYVSSNGARSGGNGSTAKQARRAPPALSSAPIAISGLPDGWSARVSVAGTVVFTHEATPRSMTVAPG